MHLHKQKGTIFLTTIIFLAVIILVCAALSIMIVRDIYSVNRLRASAQAYFLAEAGVEEAVQILYDTNFTMSGYPKTNVALGAGIYTVNLDSSKYVADKIVLITSTGTVKNVSRVLRVQVKDTDIPAFNFTALGGGKMLIAGGSTVNGDVHSNNTAVSPINPALKIGSAIFGAGTVNGSATAVGVAKTFVSGVVNPGPPLSNQPTISAPPFDAVFFNYYRNSAISGGNFYGGNTSFNSDPFAGNGGVAWVQGTVRLNGTWILTGCIVATGHIYVNKFSAGTITHNPASGFEDFPALMSKNSNVNIYDPTVLNNFVYAGSRIQILSFWGPGQVTINGALYGKQRVIIHNQTVLNYRRPNPPGIPGGTAPLQVVSWSE